MLKKLIYKILIIITLSQFFLLDIITMEFMLLNIILHIYHNNIYNTDLSIIQHLQMNNLLNVIFNEEPILPPFLLFDQDVIFNQE